MTSVEWGASTHAGHVRTVNEDSFVASPPVFAVADGMGGHDRGEVASGLVADRFRELAGEPDIDHDDVVGAVQRAHRSIRRRRDPAGREMGTTLAAVVLVPAHGEVPDHWLMVNVGDSRVYRLVDTALEQLSIDHSVVQELVDSGRLSPEGAGTHPDRHVITRAVGVGSELVPDFAVREPEPGERFLLCSDGVHGQLSEDVIRRVLIEHPDPQDAASALVAEVLSGRAPDNVTALVIDVVGSEPSETWLDEDTSPRAAVRPGIEASESMPSAESAEVRASDDAGEPSGGAGFIRVPTW